MKKNIVVNNNNNNIEVMAAKIITAAIDAINTIVDDWIDEETYTACWVKRPGRGWEYNVDEAEERQAFAEKLIFNTMRRLNKPLYGWIQFGRFVACFEHGMSLDEAYHRAQKEQATMDINIQGGRGTEEDPFICEARY